MFYDAKLERIKIRLLDGKQSEKAERKPSRVCMYHELEGAEVVDWWVVMALVGRPFLKKHNEVFLDKSFGPLGTDGEVLTDYVFGVVLESIGKAFFSTGNADVNALRTVQESLAAEHMVELGIPKDSVLKPELSKQMRTSSEVSFPWVSRVRFWEHVVLFFSGWKYTANVDLKHSPSDILFLHHNNSRPSTTPMTRGQQILST